jgi:hypothetical protein
MKPTPTMRNLIDLTESETVEEDLGSIPTSLLGGVPDDISHQLIFLAKLAAQNGLQKAAYLLKKLADKS